MRGGTGRFFEAMARAFEMDLTEFPDFPYRQKMCSVTSQCTVLLSPRSFPCGRGQAQDEIAAGSSFPWRALLCHEQKGRSRRKRDPDRRLCKNDGLKAAIEKVLKLKVTELPIDPQLMGALGAAEFARQKGMAKEA